MNKMKDIAIRFLRFLGFRRNTKYVRDYLNTSNVRMSIWMCLVIAAIEVWMIVRQTTKYYIPRVEAGRLQPGFASFWQYTGNFWLLLFLSLAILAFSTGFLFFKNQRLRFALNIGIGSVSLATSLMVIYSNSIGTFARWTGQKAIYTNALTIAVFVLGAIFSAAVLIYACFAYFKKKEIRILSQIIISLFGLICLTFGTMVSFSDFLGTATGPDGLNVLQYKEIICFLTMIVYTACLFTYRPIISITLFGAIFFAFYRMLLSVEDTRVFPDGDRVNYLTFVIMLVVVVSAIYTQRFADATKSEELEIQAKYDSLTGLYNNDYFVSLIEDRLSSPSFEPNAQMLLFADVEDFKSYNDRRGFNRGNEYLREIGDCFAEVFGRENTAHVYADHFVAITDAKNALALIDEVRAKAQSLDAEANMQLKFGGYRLRGNDEIRRCFDNARYASGLTKNAHEKYFVEFDDELDRRYRLTRHIIHALDSAIENGYIQPYYQPVVWAEDGTLCGAEALCRWIDPDPKYGSINPGVFVPFLESTHLIHKLDRCILEHVCRDIRDALDNGRPIVPVSINFSRLDFELMDPVEVLEELVHRYNVPKNYLHVEITETALSGDNGNLRNGLARLRELGYAIWLDDFGSGYSSLNVLKEFQFDVLKIDMQFLSNFASNKKAGVLIEVIVNMCARLGMKTLTEGVETKEEAAFLKKVGCGRLQGFLFGKAMPLEDIRKKIADGTYKLSAKTE